VITAQVASSETKRIIGLFPELLGAGGVQEAGRLTAAALQEIALKRQWSVEFLSLNDPPGTRSLDTGAGTVGFRGFGRAKIRFVLDAISRARSLKKSDAAIVLVAHPYLAVPGRYMRIVSSHLKVLVMAHGVEVWTTLASSRRKAVLAADLVLAPSRDTAQKLIEVQGVAPANVHRLPWPLSPSFLRLAAAPEALPLPAEFPQGRVVLTVGRWTASERYKGADELIGAIAQLLTSVPSLHLVAVGAGDDLPRLRKISRDLGVADSVHFLENLSREQIAACYASAEIFAMPSSGEGFGLVFLEAMAFSKPVVGASCGGTTDVIKDGINGFLVPPRNAGQLVQALGRLLEDESLRECLGRRGAEMVRQQFRFEAFRTEVERLLAA
jgi:phosphatidyl-myo-inositol dimannoside synthase